MNPQQLKVGDVISFQKPLGAKGVDTHRIVAIKVDHGKRLYQTKGDSNPIADPWVISFDPENAGRSHGLLVPYACNALIFARSSLGRLSLVAFVCLILLLGIFKAIAATAKDATRRTQNEGFKFDRSYPILSRSSTNSGGSRTEGWRGNRPFLSLGEATPPRAERASRAGAPGITFTSPSTGMKFVSPPQRGTTCRCPWSGMPAPAIRPMFQPRLKPSGL